MSLLMSVALALVLLGTATSLTSYSRAPATDRFSAWDLTFMGGLSAGGLGGLGVLLAAMIG